MGEVELGLPDVGVNWNGGVVAFCKRENGGADLVPVGARVDGMELDEGMVLDEGRAASDMLAGLAEEVEVIVCAKRARKERGM